MILVQLFGGLGNQMFQYAAGRALAARHDVPLRLDVRALLDSASTDTPRRYALQPFALNATIASTRALLTQALRRRLGLASRLKEQGHAYNLCFASAGPHTSLSGYWQSERYFSEVAPIICNDFTLKSPASLRDAALLDEISGVSAASVHVRRGDYAANPTTNAFHGLLPLEYYHQAANVLAAHSRILRFYVFSDDPAWVREHLTLPSPATFIDHHGPDEAHEDLRLMRACQHHIIANSSFSWWGAWLSDRPGKIVIAPRQWFRVADMDTTDICPPDWIRL